MSIESFPRPGVVLRERLGQLGAFIDAFPVFFPVRHEVLRSRSDVSERRSDDRDVKTHHFTRSSHDRLGRESILRRASLDNVHDVEIVTRAVVELKKKVEIGFTDSTKIKRLPSSALASRQVFVGEASRV